MNHWSFSAFPARTPLSCCRLYNNNTFFRPFTSSRQYRTNFTNTRMRYQSLFTCGAASTLSHGLLWIEAPVQGTKQNFVVYAVHNLVAVLDLDTKTVVGTLRGCTGCITSISNCIIDDTVVLVAACDDGSVKMCCHRGSDSLIDWSPFQALDGLVASASALHCIVLDSAILVSAADSKGSVVTWLCDLSTSTSKVIAQFKLPSAQMSKAVHFAELPSSSGSSNIALFVGSVDARVHIYVATKESINAAASAGWERTSQPAVFTSAGAVPGHEEWVTCLSSLATDSKGMYLASGSQDSKIRVWNIKALSASAVSSAASALAAVDLSAELDVESEAVEGEVIVESNEDETESEARLTFSAGGVQYAVLLESLLVGHEDWVTSVHWMPAAVGSSPEDAIEYRLFSTSMDRNMVIWSPDASAGGVWVPKVRMGDIGGALGGMIGGNLLGFVGGATSPRGFALIGVGYGGSFHLWEQQQGGEEAGRWTPVPLSSGHFASVNDLCWSDDTRGDYLTTVSADQTCRIFAPLQRTAGAGPVWKEISRPQIHGYDLNCVVQAPQRGVHTLYTAGEEKLIRVFDAPNSVLRGLEKLCGISMSNSAGASRMEQAYIPELGLSNKAQEFMSKQEQTEQEARSVARINWSAEPLESQLADLTLWPEVNKMFGHNNEVMCMSMSADGMWIASASKARDANTASVLLWTAPAAAVASSAPGAAHLQLVDRLPGHESTVVCLRFSPDSRFLVSSGKDRALCLFAHQAESGTFVPVVCKRSAHKRIVWDCSWTPDSAHVVTASRDGSCKVWKLTTQTNEQGQLVYDLACVCTFSPFAGTAVTAVDIFHPVGGVSATSNTEGWMMALGAETGDIQVHRLPCGGDSAEAYPEPALLLSVPATHAHGATVRRIRWRPRGDGEQALEFASCGEDKTVRVHRLVL